VVHGGCIDAYLLAQGYLMLVGIVNEKIERLSMQVFS